MSMRAVGFLWRWLGRSAAARPAVEVVLYTRADCPLCDLALAEIERAGRKYALAVRVVDVDADARAAAAFGDRVPVVWVNGKLRFRGGMNPVLLARLLRAEARRGAGAD